MHQKGRNIARILVVIWLGVILCGLFWGRRLQRQYTWAIDYIPLVALALSCAITLAACLFFKLDQLNQQKFSLRDLGAFCIASALFSGILILVCRFLLSLEIEYVHAIKYSILGLLFFFCISHESRVARFGFAFLASAAIGISEETLQLWVPDRFFDPHDIACNVLSCFIGSSYAYSLSVIKKLLTTTRP